MSDNKDQKFFGVNDSLWGHKWGFKDSQFVINDDGSVTFTGNRYKGVSGENLPYLVPFVEKILDIEIKTKPYFNEVEKKHVADRSVNRHFMDERESNFNSDQYTFEDGDRILHSHGQNGPDEVFKVLYNKLEKFTRIQSVDERNSNSNSQIIIIRGYKLKYQN